MISHTHWDTLPRAFSAAEPEGGGGASSSLLDQAAQQQIANDVTEIDALIATGGYGVVVYHATARVSEGFF
jgi:hypothetical protein